MTDLTVKEICEGFVYNQLEGKGLNGWAGKLTIQPEYQRNYLYHEKNNKKEMAVIDSMLGRAAPTGSADVTADGEVDIADVNALIDLMLGKQ